MSSNKRPVGKEYWEKNIEGFSGFYDKKSEEDINAGRFFKYIYKKTLFPIEKKYMKDRYDFVCQYIDDNVGPGLKMADIGCGSGVFTKRAIERGARVFAIDYAESAISLTRRNLSEAELRSAEFMTLDVVKDRIPAVDVAISIGVLPYVADIDAYFGNILPCCRKFLFNYLSSDNLLNRLRKKITFLDVRNYSYHSRAQVREKLKARGFAITLERKLATGVITCCERA